MAVLLNLFSFFLSLLVSLKLEHYTKECEFRKGYLHLCPRMDFLLTLHNNDSLYTNYKNVCIELDS